jgi:hypothetical protein
MMAVTAEAVEVLEALG